MKALVALCTLLLASGCAVRHYHIAPATSSGTVTTTTVVEERPVVYYRQHNPVYYWVPMYPAYPMYFGGSVSACRGRVCGRLSWW